MSKESPNPEENSKRLCTENIRSEASQPSVSSQTSDLDAQIADTDLQTATRHGHLDVVMRLLETDVNINQVNQNGYSALHYAAELRYEKILEELINAKANVNVCDTEGKTPLHLAAGHGNLHIVARLIREKANIHARDAQGNTPSHYAAGNGWCHIVRILLRAGSPVNVHNKQKRTMLHYAVRYGYTDIIELLLDKHIDINFKDADGHTSLHVATWYADKSIIELLVNIGDAGVNCRSNSGHTPLHYAFSRDCPRIIAFLLDKGADVTIRDVHDCLPVQYSVKDLPWNFGSILELETYFGNHNNNVRTPLYNVTKQWCFIYIFKVLVNSGTNLNVKDTSGNSVLHHSVQYDLCDVEFIKYVLQYQKDVNVLNGEGKTPLNYLMERRYRAVDEQVALIKILIESGAYWTRSDCEAICSSRLLRYGILRDVNICTRAVVNKFNKKDLPLMYKLCTNVHLPCMEYFFITENSRAIDVIQQSVENEIKTDGMYNVLNISSVLPLTLLAVEAFVTHFERVFNVVEPQPGCSYTE